MKHNISITMDQKLFRQIENTRGREKRSTFIEHLIQTALKNYPNQPQTTNPKQAASAQSCTPLPFRYAKSDSANVPNKDKEN